MKFIINSIFFCFVAVSAQDFGYEYYSLTEFRSLGGSYSFSNFSARNSNSLPDSQRLAISTHLPAIEFRQLNTRLTLGYQKYSIAGVERTAYSVFAQQGNDLALSRDSRPNFYIPIFASANYLRAEGKSPNVRTFDIGSVGMGAGLKYRYFDRNFGIEAYGAASIHYSTAGFSAEYGTQNSIMGEILFLLPEIIYEGIIFGGRAEQMNWNMNTPTLNYQRLYSGVFLGILF